MPAAAPPAGPTHTRKDLPSGGFVLEVREGATPDETSMRLAADIKTELERPDAASRITGTAKLDALRAIATQGLAGDAPDPAAAYGELYRLFGRPRVYLLDGDIQVDVPRDASQEQLDFLITFDDAERLLAKLRQRRPTPAIDMLRAIPRLPQRLLQRLAPPAAPTDPPGAPESPAREEKAVPLPPLTVDALLRIGRMAFPDRASDRAPDPALAKALLERLIARDVADFGPGLRGAYLKDLAAAFAVTLMAFAALLLLLAGGWAALFGKRDLLPSHTTFGMCIIAMGFLFLGAWLSAAQRLNSSAAAAIESVISETFDSWIRAVLLLGTGIVVLVLLHKGVVVVELSQALSSRQVLQTLPAAVVVGALLGLAERSLPTALTGRSESLASRLGIQAPSNASTPAGASGAGAPAAGTTPAAQAAAGRASG